MTTYKHIKVVFIQSYNAASELKINRKRVQSTHTVCDTRKVECKSERLKHVLCLEKIPVTIYGGLKVLMIVFCLTIWLLV